jgi:hypothetical protein
MNGLIQSSFMGSFPLASPAPARFIRRRMLLRIAGNERERTSLLAQPLPANRPDALSLPRAQRGTQ